MIRSISFSLFSLIISTLLALPVSAEIYKCNGQWTNKPCDGTVEQRIKEMPAKQVDTTKLIEEAVKEQQGDDPDAPTAPAPVKEEKPAAPTEPLAPRLEVIRKLRKTNQEYSKKPGGTSLTSGEIDRANTICMNRSLSFDECLGAASQLEQKLMDRNKGGEGDLDTALGRKPSN